MVEMELICRAADHALTSIASPYFELYRGGNQAAMLRAQSDRRHQVLLPLYGLKPELEYRPTARALRPCIQQVEHAIVSDPAR